MNLFQSVPQELISGLLLFDLFHCDLFLFVEEIDIMSYVDDDTLYLCSENIETLWKKLK